MAGYKLNIDIGIRWDIQSLFVFSTYFYHLPFFKNLLIRFNDYKNKFVYFKTICSSFMVKLFKMYVNKFTPYGAFPYFGWVKAFTIIFL